MQEGTSGAEELEDCLETMTEAEAEEAATARGRRILASCIVVLRRRCLGQGWRISGEETLKRVEMKAERSEEAGVYSDEPGKVSAFCRSLEPASPVEELAAEQDLWLDGRKWIGPTESS